MVLHLDEPAVILLLTPLLLLTGLISRGVAPYDKNSDDFVLATQASRCIT
jgi:hypothetical protein